MTVLIDINQADAETLTQLTGIGTALAARIIDYRQTVHPFEEVIELTAVPGISERLVRSFADQVTVGSMAALAADDVQPETAVDDATAEPAAADVGAQAPAAQPPADEPPEEQTDLDEAPSEPAADAVAEPTTADTQPVLVQQKETPPLHTPAASIPTPTSEPVIQMEDNDSQMSEEQSTMADETAVSPPPPEEAPIARRRGCLFVILGAVAGAILGMALTLAVLAGLNGGTLRYSQANTRLQNELEDATQAIDTLTTQLDQANEVLSYESTRTGEMAVGQNELNASVNEMQELLNTTQAEVDTAQAEIETLTETAVDLDERIDTISASAETFDAFLTGMRELLLGLQGDDVTTPATPESASTGEAPIPSSTPFPTPESNVTVTATRRPTRTPRPTSTPISLPTATPAQQP